MSNVEKVKQMTTESKLLPVEQMVKKSVVTLGECLPQHMNAERLVRIALTTMRLNPALYKCTPQSFMGALFQSAQLGLEPNVEGQAYIIPFKNKRKKPDGSWHTVPEAQFQIGYKGYVELFYRHQNALSLDMQKVCAHDEFDYQYGTDAYLRHKPLFDEDLRGLTKGYYAIAKLINGACVFKYMGIDECLEHGKKHSKCWDKKNECFYSYSPWATNLDAMCLKTVLIQLMKLLPKSFEMQRAIATDGTIKTTVEKDMFEVKDETNWENGDVIQPSDAPQSSEDGSDSTISPEGTSYPSEAEINELWDDA